MAAAKKPNPNVAASFDPNIANSNRTFELVLFTALSETLYERRVRIRVAQGGLEDNVYEVGGTQQYCGMISEQDAKGKWTGYSWGHMPLIPEGCGYAREIFPELAPPKKDEKP